MYLPSGFLSAPNTEAHMDAGMHSCVHTQMGGGVISLNYVLFTLSFISRHHNWYVAALDRYVGFV